MKVQHIEKWKCNLCGNEYNREIDAENCQCFNIIDDKKIIIPGYVVKFQKGKDGKYKFPKNYRPDYFRCGVAFSEAIIDMDGYTWLTLKLTSMIDENTSISIYMGNTFITKLLPYLADFCRTGTLIKKKENKREGRE